MANPTQTIDKDEDVVPFRETTVGSVASNVAAMVLEKTIEEGRQIKIPSLGLTIERGGVGQHANSSVDEDRNQKS
jgi:hypothetical protein